MSLYLMTVPEVEVCRLIIMIFDPLTVLHVLRHVYTYLVFAVYVFYLIIYPLVDP